MIRAAYWLSLALAAAGCAPPEAATSAGPDAPGSGDPDPLGPPDEVTGQPFDPSSVPGDPEDLTPTDRVLEVRITMADAAWADLRRQTRSIFEALAGDCMASPSQSPYTWFRADVEIDGVAVPAVAVKKKGFIGSLSITKPGLKLDFDNYADGRTVHGVERMTLNNTPQDPTMLRTCLAYETFRSIGAPAPRCGFAHVVVNGEDLGIYASVETVNDHFADRALGQDDVPLFEGTLSDFRDGWTGTFDPDSDEADPALLQPVVEAVEAGDLASLDAAIDVEAFLRFTAGEAMTGHWDGYGWNTNNYYVAFDPSDGRAHFLPWGPDAAWSRASPAGGTDWVAANSAVPRALMTTAGGMPAYRAEVERILTDVWSEDAMLDRIDELADLIAPWHDIPGRHRSTLEAVIANQDDVMWAGLSGADPSFSWGLRPEICLPEQGTIAVDFETRAGSLNGSATPGTCSGSWSWYGDTYELTGGTAYAGEDAGYGIHACVLPVGDFNLLSYITQPIEEMTPGTWPSEHTVTRATLYYQSEDTAWEWTPLSWVEGELQLVEADATTGAPIRGSYAGVLWQAAW